MLQPMLKATSASTLRALPTRSQARDWGRPWRRLREQALVRDCGLCVLCKEQGQVTKATEVDHIVSVEEGGEHMDLNNLRSLCSPCHAGVTADQTRRRYGVG